MEASPLGLSPVRGHNGDVAGPDKDDAETKRRIDELLMEVGRQRRMLEVAQAQVEQMAEEIARFEREIERLRH